MLMRRCCTSESIVLVCVTSSSITFVILVTCVETGSHRICRVQQQNGRSQEVGPIQTHAKKTTTAAVKAMMKLGASSVTVTERGPGPVCRFLVFVSSLAHR